MKFVRYSALRGLFLASLFAALTLTVRAGLDESGQVIGVRELAHPHVNEQPFTRSVSITIPDSVKTITVRANDSVHETGGKTVDIAVPHP